MPHPLIALLSLQGGTTVPPVVFDAKKAAARTFAMIQKEAYHAPSGFYGEEWELGKRPSATAFNWSLGVMYTGLAAGARFDPAMRKGLDSMTQSSVAYWNDQGPVPGFDVLPGPKPIDRYYDDNMWMCLAQIEAYDITKRVDLLLRARETFQYILSGESKELGGGIYWRESEKSSKNTCSNGPAALCAVELYKRTKDKRYLADAIRIYRWTDEKLRDPKDGLMWDNIAVKDGKIGDAKWSYNTALMLRVESELLELKALPGLTKANLFDHADAAVKRWVLPSGAFRDEAKFAHMLFEALLKIKAPGYGLEGARKTLIFLETQNRDKAGHFLKRWDSVAASVMAKPALIDQASALRAFSVGARFGL